MWKVIVIEDDPMLADIHRKYVDSQNDLTCSGVIYDASGASQLIESTKPDLILLDIYMPQMNGIDFLIKLREDKQNIDVILITAARNVEQVETAYRYGAVDYLVKPFEFSRLDKALDKFRARKAIMKSPSAASQEELDKAFGTVDTRTRPQLPKGLHDRTLKRVKAVIEKCGEPVTIDDIAAEVDMSKVTLRRYLEHLEKTGEVKIEMSYGSRGRPSYTYRSTKGF